MSISTDTLARNYIPTFDYVIFIAISRLYEVNSSHGWKQFFWFESAVLISKFL